MPLVPTLLVNGWTLASGFEYSILWTEIRFGDVMKWENVNRFIDMSKSSITSLMVKLTDS